jgi:hypothetical protein
VIFRGNWQRACAVAIVLAAASPAYAQDPSSRLVIGVTVVAPCQVSFAAGLAPAASTRREPDVSCLQSEAFETKISSARVTAPVDISTSGVPVASAAVQVSATAEQPAPDTRGGASIDVRIVEVAF